jgi:hypothetical protein
LVLPDPKAFTRIGYSIFLAFPDRRDQQALSALLDGNGMADAEPPLGPTIAAIIAGLGQFRPRFQDAAREFRAIYDRAAAGAESVDRLLEHRLWTAVREAALRGRGAEASAGPEYRPTLHLLAYELDDTLTLFLAATDSTPPAAGLSVKELPVQYGCWRYAVVNDHTLELSEGTQSVVRRILSGELRLPVVSQQQKTGVFLFAPAQHGLLELAGAETVTESTVALVRDSIRSGLAAVPGFAGSRSATSAYNGWSYLFGVKAQRLPSKTLEGTPLAHFWLLHESVSSKPVHAVNGVRVDGGWLGYREVLPDISVREATSVRLEKAGGPDSVSCRQSEDSTWTITTPHDLDGEWSVIASSDNGKASSVRLNFFSMPLEENYKRPSVPSLWLVESNGGTKALHEADAPLPKLVGRECATLLSALDFTAKRTAAAQPTATQPRRQTEKAGAGILVRRRVATREEQAKRAQRLVAILAGSANRRAHVPYGDWCRLVERIFRLSERKHVQHVIRGWEEHGLIDVAYSLSWRTRIVVARPPSLIVHHRGPTACVVVSGLVLPSTLNAAEGLVGAVTPIVGSSPFVPAPVRIAIERDADVVALSEILRIPTVAAPAINVPSDGPNEAPPVGYACISNSAPWSLRGAPAPPNTSVRRWFRVDRPDYWVVTAKNQQFWSYALNPVASWLCCKSSLRPCEARSDGIEAIHAYLPLQIVRAAVSLGAVTSGPIFEDPSSHAYQVSSTALRDEILTAAQVAGECAGLSAEILALRRRMSGFRHPSAIDAQVLPRKR